MRRQANRLATVLFWTACVPGVAFGQAADLAGRVAKLEQTLSSRGLVDLLNEVEALKREMQNLRGELENQAYTIEELKKSQNAALMDLDRRLQGSPAGTAVNPTPTGMAAPLPTLQAAPADAVAGAPAAEGDLQVQPPPSVDPITGLPTITTVGESGQMSVQPSTPEAQPAPVSTPDAPVAPIATPPTFDDAVSEAAYRDAFGYLKAGDYDQAITAFTTFQQLYPNSQYGDNAQFWLAEAYYVKRDFAAALPEYQKMLVAYPASKKLSHAMLKVGYSYSELGQVAEAVAVLEELQQRFPGTAAAQLAAQRLTHLSSVNAAPAN